MSNSFNIDNFNSFLEKASQTISCGTECQRKKKEELLKQNYINKQSNLATASDQLQVSEKEYITFTQGELAYNQLEHQQINQKSDQIASTFQQNFDEEVAKIESQLSTYNGLLINFKNIVELYLKYKKDNVELYKTLKDDTSDILTNERKTFYQEQGIDNLKFIYSYILIIVYVIVAISFGVLSFVYPSQISWKYRLAIMISLIGLPFISSWLLSYIIEFAHYIYDLFPKNVRLSI